MRRPTPEEVIAAVAEVYGVTVDDILGRSRDRAVMSARRTAILLAEEVLNVGPTTLMSIFRREHSTVIFHLRRSDRLFRIRWWRENYNKSKIILQKALDARAA